MVLIASTMGQCKYFSSSFGRTSLLEDMRTAIQAFCDCPGSNSDPGPAEDADYDPMAEVEQEDGAPASASKTRGRGQKRNRHYKNHRANTSAR